MSGTEHSADYNAPMTMTAEMWLGALADAWDAGYMAFAHHAATFNGERAEPVRNPYRVTPPAVRGGDDE